MKPLFKIIAFVGLLAFMNTEGYGQVLGAHYKWHSIYQENNIEVFAMNRPSQVRAKMNTIVKIVNSNPHTVLVSFNPLIKCEGGESTERADLDLGQEKVLVEGNGKDALLTF